jgi:hypothetical protein
MNLRSCSVVFLIFCIHSGCAPSKSHPGNSVLPATELHVYGRYAVDDPRGLELISSAAHFGFSFEGKQCQVFASLSDTGSHSYLQYELDGVYQKRFRLEGNAHQPLVFDASSEGAHTLWIYKTTEAHTGPVFIEKITGRNVKPLRRPAMPLIEFIGNSITCGAAADASEVPCGTGAYHDQHNAYDAYGPRAARALGAEFILSSVSGIGIYRNWNSDGPTMPEVYEKVDFQDGNPKRWNFDLFPPKIISIALGTNDLSEGDGKRARLPFDSARFVDGFIQFAKLVQSKYPDARMALLSSPMINGTRRTTLQNCLTAVKNNIDAFNPSHPIALYFFQPMKARGCTGHPSVEDHAILAEELIPFFKKLLDQ